MKSRRLEVRRFAIDRNVAVALRNSNKNEGNTNHYDDTLFPLLLSVPIHGRITTLLPFRIPSSKTDLLFFTTDTQKYAVISYVGPSSSSSSLLSTTAYVPYNIMTHVSGDLREFGISIRGRLAECGPLVAIEPSTNHCIALHLYDGYITLLPINKSYQLSSSLSRISATAASSSSSTIHSSSADSLLFPPFHCRIEEHTIRSMTFLIPSTKAMNTHLPQLTLLYQDSKEYSHIVTHSVDLAGKTLILHTSTTTSVGNTVVDEKHRRSGTTSSSSSSSMKTPPPTEEQLCKNLVDGGSGIIIPIPPWDTSSTSTISSNSHQDEEEEGTYDKKLPSSTTTTTTTTKHTTSSFPLTHTVSKNNKNLYGGILIMGQKEITYLTSSLVKTLPMAESFILSQTSVTPFVHKHRSMNPQTDPVIRFLVGNEFGQLFFLALERLSSPEQGHELKFHIELLGTTSISSTLTYMALGYCFVGSQLGDSQLVQIVNPQQQEASPSNRRIQSSNSESMDIVKSPTEIPSSSTSSCIHVVEEYTNLGPIVDFDLISESFSPISTITNSTPENSQSMMVCASGAGKDGSIRIVRNGVGMREYAAIELPGIRGMWSIKNKFHDTNDSYLMQSYLGETRILGVVIDEMQIDDDDNEKSSTHGNLEEVSILAFDLSRTTLFVGNVAVPDETSSLVVQVTDTEVHLIDIARSECLETWSPSSLCDTVSSIITIAIVNRFGQIILVLRGGKLIYLTVMVEECIPKLLFMGSTTLHREVSCVDFESFTTSSDGINKSSAIAVGLWDEYSLKVLSLIKPNLFADILMINLGQERNESGKELPSSEVGVQRHRMARSIRLVTLEAASTASPNNIDQDIMSPTLTSSARVNMLFVGLGNGGLISFVVNIAEEGPWLLHSRKEISLGFREIGLVPFSSSGVGRKVCILATGDRPTVIYLAGGGNSQNSNPKICYSAIHVTSDAVINQPMSRNTDLVVTFATPFYSSLLFPSLSQSDVSQRSYFSLCVCDESMFRIGLIDDIQKLHVSTFKLGMAPRRISYHPSGHLICVGCIDDGVTKVNGSIGGEVNMGNCIKFFDEKSFEEVDRLNLDPFEMILCVMSMSLRAGDIDEPMNSTEKINEESDTLKGGLGSFVVIGTAYAYPDEDEPSRGRILIMKCHENQTRQRVGLDSKPSRIKLVSELQVKGGVYSVCPFLNGSMLATVNSKTHLLRLVTVDTETGNSPLTLALKFFGAGYHGHILSLIVKGLCSSNEDIRNEMQPHFAIVGDLMRSISVLQYSPQFNALEEIARDYNQNWTTAIEMLSEDIYIGAENFHNIFVLRRNAKAQSEELRNRLDTVGAFHLGELPNKMLRGSLVIATNTAASYNPDGIISNKVPKPNVGSRTLLGTVDGSIGTILGLDVSTFKFLKALERSMSRNVRSIGDLSIEEYRAFRGERERSHFPSRGFVDGDYVESFLDLDQLTMEAVVKHMNHEGRWEVDRSSDATKSLDEIEFFKRVSSSYTLTIDDVRDVVEDLSMLH